MYILSKLHNFRLFLSNYIVEKRDIMRITILVFSMILYLFILYYQIKMLSSAFSVKKKILFFSISYLIGCIPLFCVFDYLVRGIPFIEFMAYIGYILLGFFLYYFLSLLVILFFKKGIALWKKKSNLIFNKATVYLASGISFFICVWGILAAQIPEYTYQKLDIGLKETMKITVVSDIHFGATGSFLSLERMVKNINKTNPDLILLIGDVFDHKVEHLDQTYFSKTMNQLNCKYGVYAVTGNHEFMQNDINQIQQFYEGTKIQLLLDQEVIINQMLRIAGRIDYRHGRKEVKDIISDSNLPLIVLDHQPQFFKDVKDIAALQISGHTHNGQIFPGDILIFLMNQILFQSPSDGVHTYQDFTLAITRGYGTWGFPMRLTGPSQIMVFEL